MSLWRYFRGDGEEQRHGRMAANLWVLLGLGVAGIYLFRRNLLGQSLKEKHGAFIQFLELDPPPPPAPPLAPPPLTNLTFAVKDIFDVEGFVTGFGNPTWRDTHQPAFRTAHAVGVLVDAGARCLGKTHMDELAYSIQGENFHYSTPDNPAAPGRVPGGSSSGSAVAVAGGHADFALGTDTGGSVRVPAAFCGILGIRPSHGAVSTVGVVPMAQSFDTVGWFAKDALTLRLVGQVLLGSAYPEIRLPRRFVVADDLFKITLASQARNVAVVVRTIEKLFGKQNVGHVNVGDHLANKVPALRESADAGKGDVGFAALEALRDSLFLLQAYEFKTNHEEWLKEASPKLGPGIAERVQASLVGVEEEGLLAAQRIKTDVQAALIALLRNDMVLVLPTCAGPPPRKNSRLSTLNEFRARSFMLLSIAGMSGCPQVSVPVGSIDGIPQSVSFLARPGADQLLLDTVVAVYGTLQEQAAAPEVASVTNVDSEGAETAKDQGNAAFKKQEYQTAVKFYSEAIKLDGGNPNYYTNRAMAHMKLGSFKEVVADCSKAISLDRKSVKAYFRRGRAREYLGYYREAEEDYKQVLVLEPTNRDTQDALRVLQKSLYQ